MTILTNLRRAAAGTAACAMVFAAPSSLPVRAAEQADLPAAVEAARAALAEAWNAAPLSFATALFVDTPAKGYGRYTPRETATFAPDEPIHVYAEPVGFGYGRNDAEYTIDLVAGFELRNTSGQVLAQGDDFARLTQSSRREVREFPAALSYRFEGLIAGDYVLVTRLKDANSDKSGDFALPFSIAGE